MALREDLCNTTRNNLRSYSRRSLQKNKGNAYVTHTQYKQQKLRMNALKYTKELLLQYHNFSMYCKKHEVPMIRTVKLIEHMSFLYWVSFRCI